MKETSNINRILLAAARLSRARDGGAFTGAELVVELWKHHRAAFGLRGYESLYPDANRVFCKLAGERGAVGRGWLEAVGPREYRLTLHGEAQAARIEAA